ncbi:hypothetical protein PM076_07430 [Halorubrum ezzemoulense]|uniref:Uncharacterized protein n=1 Tax=Halorubrum ezzemoulense TaxID=337243 RepID=A0ABT4Z0S9_HALEZ|nr:hypothetical protein [Halorubrum ezzemoulense]MDB2243306.1 hypothetical protein [Halorubrum ezzemoulense]MDB2277041.1 hypothetical protein [Halorubrum ezzemoulense]MDB2288668.1 hypothetical protein [Halorubrum ezzemoulense]MDB2291221.1 hypothetical protein [Halorubrum ezzemoulense]MDB2296139.1 hypothetical protein [Halorubrum ezzemoulense]
MSNPRTGPEAYSMPIDTEDGETVADDKIITLDAHTGEPLTEHPQYQQPTLEPEDLKTIARELNEVGEQQLAIDVQTARQALENNPEHELTFTAIDLNQLVVAMAVAHTKCVYDEDMEGMRAILQLGRVINESADTLLAEGAQWTDMPGVRPAEPEDNKEYINPFAVVTNKQRLSFVDTHGDQLSREELQKEQDSSNIVGK